MQGCIHLSSTGNGILYWILVGLGLLVFTPSVLLPEWRSYQAIKFAEQRELHRREVLQNAIENERRILENMQRDPAVMARLAQRELGFKKAGDQQVVVDVPPDDEAARPVVMEAVPFSPSPVELPVMLTRVLSVIPAFDFDAIFCDPDTRRIVMGMSIGLLGLAVVLFHGPAPSRARKAS